MLALIAYLLLFSSLSQATFLPKPFNLTEHIATNAPFCQEARCIVDWIEDEHVDELLASNCSDFQSFRPSKDYIGLLSNGRIQKEVVDTLYKIELLSHCPNSCAVYNGAKMFWSIVASELQFANVFSDEYLVQKICGVEWKNYCKAYGKSVKFRFFFGLFALPATFILNSINLATISKLIGTHKSPGAALYFHKAEIYSDVLCSILFYLWNNLFFFWCIDNVIQMCQPATVPYFSVHDLTSALVNLFMFVNQCTLYNIVSDRCSALKDAFNHYKNSGRHTARQRLIKTIAYSVALYTPLLFIYAFKPLFAVWNEFVTVLGSLYAFAPLACVVAQTVKAVRYQKLYEAHKKQKTTRATIQEQKKIKRDEKEKRVLVMGTVGLNIVATCLNMLRSVFEYSFSNFDDPWWIVVSTVLSSISVFVNGTGAFVIHVLLLKPYRAAFWETAFGKLVSKARGN